MEKKEPTKKSPLKKIILIFLFILLLAGLAAGSLIYRALFRPNIVLHGKNSGYLYIPTGSDFNAVLTILNKHSFLRDPGTFTSVALWKKYPEKVKPGRYRLRKGMNNNELVNLLRAGKQEPVDLVFHNIRTKQDLAGKISRQIEADSTSLIHLLNDDNYLRNFGTGPACAFTLFIPNTYEFFWNTSADQFIRRMAEEQKKFWSGSRTEKAKRSGMEISSVVILASIVEKETSRDREKPVIAGVYLNRLKKGWPLQADPTLIFAWNDYSIRRVLNKHKEINSPYNTYLHTGLPPGPICLPSVASIDAVLDHATHEYMYFCAKEDLSGYHNFAVTLDEHNRNAARYQAALKKLNIH